MSSDTGVEARIVNLWALDIFRDPATHSATCLSKEGKVARIQPIVSADRVDPICQPGHEFENRRSLGLNLHDPMRGQ